MKALIKTGIPFTFTTTNNKAAKVQLKKYPQGRKQSAVLALLDLAQRQNDGWLSQEACEYVADYLSMPYVKILEIVTFYTMFHLQPTGSARVYVCRTVPCCLLGGEEISQALQKEHGLQVGESSANISLFECECLGACTNAPVVMINDTYLEKTNIEEVQKQIKEKAGGVKC